MKGTKNCIQVISGLVLILFLLPFHSSSAQYRLPEPILFPYEGFNRIERLAQDDRGFLWLGTNRGLFCFDGITFRRVQQSVNNTTAIDNGTIYDLLFDRTRNWLWLTSSTGIYALDLRSETFAELPFYRELASQNTIDECGPLFQDRTGTIWIGVDGFGLIRVDSTSHRYFPAAGCTWSGEWNIKVTISSIAQDITQDSILWLAAGFSGLVRFDMNSGRYDIPDKGKIPELSRYRLLPTTVLPTKENIYLGNPWDRYGFVYDLNTGQYRELDFTEHYDIWGGLAQMADFAPDAFWACNRAELLLIDRHTGNLLAHFSKPIDVQTFRERMLATPGHLWIGSDKGLLLYDFTSYRVENHLFEQDENNGPFYLSSILEKQDGSGLWVAFLKNQYVYEYNLYTRKTLQLPWREKWTSNPHYFLRMQDGRLLVIADHGFYELRDSKLIYLPFCEEQAAAKVEFSKAVQDSRGQIWVASRWGGLYKLDLKTGRCTQCLDEQGRPEMRHLFRDKDDNIWVPYTGGFSVYHAARDSFFHFPYQADQEKTVREPSGFVQDAAGNIWISDVSVGGLMRVDPLRLEEGGQERVVAHNGLWSNQMQQLTTDKYGQIWAVTKAGLQVFDPVKKTFALYGESAGFRLRGPNPEYSNFVPSYISRLSTGEMVVGYTNGFALFHPDSLRANLEKPRPYILSLRNGRDTLIGTPHTGDLEKISLRYDQNDLDIAFSAITWRETDKIYFQYRLSGLDEEWKETKQSSLNFTNLAPGDYAFQLYAVNSAGIKPEEPLSVHFEIRPPWWQTGWAYSLYVLLASAIVYTFYQYKKSQWELKARLAMEHREAEQLKKLDAIKTHLYTNITHEFRTPITVILGMARQVRDNPGDWFREGIQMIIRRGLDLLRLVNQMLDLSKLEVGSLPVHEIRGDVIEFLRYLVESFHSYAETENIQMNLQIEVETFYIDYDPEKLKTIVSNLLSNAIKFTPAGGKVWVTVKEDRSAAAALQQTTAESCLRIAVRDTGIGIPAEELPHIFDRFYRVEKEFNRKDEAPSPPSGANDLERKDIQAGYGAQGGTGIGLALTRELVGLLGGQIVVESKPGEGSSFTVSLPVTQIAPEVDSLDFLAEKEVLVPVAAPVPDLASAGAAQDERPLLLIIEDDRDVVRYLGACLGEAYRLEAAFNGRIGIEKARELIPDIVISDVMMPEADGFEVCQTLKSDRLTSHIPIILLTAKADAASRIEGLDCGADAYLAKPFEERELLVRLKKLLENRNRLREFYTSGAFFRKEVAMPSGKIQLTKRDREFLDQLLAVVEENLSDASFSAEVLSKALYLSYSTCRRKIKALTGMTVQEYIGHYRIHRAARLLVEEPDRTVTSIALETGFSTGAYFSRQFRKVMNCPPSAYRNNK